MVMDEASLRTAHPRASAHRAIMHHKAGWLPEESDGCTAVSEKHARPPARVLELLAFAVQKESSFARARECFLCVCACARSCVEVRRTQTRQKNELVVLFFLIY